jgi:hypothetical protein
MELTIVADDGQLVVPIASNGGLDTAAPAASSLPSSEIEPATGAVLASSQPQRTPLPAAVLEKIAGLRSTWVVQLMSSLGSLLVPRWLRQMAGSEHLHLSNNGQLCVEI